MKKIIILFFCSFFWIPLNFISAASENNDDVVMNIAGENISTSVFNYYYKKNNSYKKESLEDYVDLFIKFKLKVAEAKSQKLDTLPSYISEIKSYRDDLAKSYLIDTTEVNKLLKEAYYREQQYVESAHILIRLDLNASPKDSLIAYNKIMNVYNIVSKNPDAFETYAKKYSEDGSNKNGGNIGYIVGGKLVYSYENVMFNTPVGAISKPFRSKFGYHIVKVLDKKPIEKIYKSAHIFKSARNDDQFVKAEKEINEIYFKLNNGESFTSLAKKYSDDKSTSSKGGVYDFLSCGTFPYVYEKNVFALKKGEYSKPFKSKYGWHIVRALDFKSFPSFNSEKEKLTKLINNGQRKLLPKKALLNKLKKQYNFNQDGNLLNNLCSSYSLDVDSFFITNGQNNSVLFSFKNRKALVADFIEYLKNQNSKDFYKNYNEYVDSIILEYEDNVLESKYPAFGNLMNEYRDGVLLFNVSNKDVWQKSSSDTLGLIKFFKKNKKNYYWKQPHYKGYIIYSKDNDIIKTVKTIIKNTDKDSLNVVIDRTFNDSIRLVKVEYGLYKQGDGSIVDSLVYGNDIKYKEVKTWPFIVTYGKNLKLKPSEYSDVNGPLISDYQKYKENLWVDKLRDKFKVVIFENVLNSVNIE